MKLKINKEVNERWKNQIDSNINAASEVAIRLDMIDKSLYALDIMLTACVYFGVSLDEVVAKYNCNERVCEAKSIIAYIISENELCGLNKRTIAKLMNRKNSSFVSQCIENVTKSFFHQGHDGEIATAIAAINSKLVKPE